MALDSRHARHPPAGPEPQHRAPAATGDRVRGAARRQHPFNTRVSLLNYVASDARPEEMLIDESAGATVKQLGDALTEIDVNGHVFGQCSLTLVLIDRDAQAVERSAAEAIKVLSSHD